MRVYKPAIGLLASMSVAASAATQTEEACVSESEAAAIFAVIMPDMINGLRDKCAAHLPANSYLVANADALVSRYTAVADLRWPAAKLAFGKISGDEEMTAKLPDQLLRPLIGTAVGLELFKDFKPADCHGASRIVESLAPLPPENVSLMIGAILTITEKGKNSSMPICKIEAD